MTEIREGQDALEPDGGLVAQVLAIAPLPRLAPGAHRAASATIEELLYEYQQSTGYALAFDTLGRVVSHLRSIGDPSSAEVFARVGAHRFRLQGKVISTIDMLNLAGLSCLDQGAFDDADSCFREALRLIPSPDSRGQTVVLLVNRATLMTETGQFEHALTLYKDVVKFLAKTPRRVYGALDSLLPEEVRALVTNNAGWVLIRQARETQNDGRLLTRASRAITAALALPLTTRTRIIAQGNRAEILVRKGDFRSAERVLAPLESECATTGNHRLLPEVYRRWAQVCAFRGEIPPAVEWARKAMQSSLIVANPRQELRIVEVFLEILRDVTTRARIPLAALESTGEPVVTQVLELLQSKDTYAGGNHSTRVATLARKIAIRLTDGDSGKEKWVKLVELDGLFHDFGKLRIPWCLLNKVSRLTERDWRLLRAHTLMGEEMLFQLGFRGLGRVASSHHERPDGKGYPRGTNTRCLESSIVAVADAFEAMTSPSRVYARPKTISHALREVSSNAGSQFHTDVAEALVSLMRRRSSPAPA